MQGGISLSPECCLAELERQQQVLGLVFVLAFGLLYYKLSLLVVFLLTHPSQPRSTGNGMQVSTSVMHHAARRIQQVFGEAGRGSPVCY